MEVGIERESRRGRGSGIEKERSEEGREGIGREGRNREGGRE